MTPADQYHLFERTSDLIVVVAVDSGKILDANPAIQERLDWTRKELCEARFHDLISAPPEIVDGWLHQISSRGGGVFECHLKGEYGSGIPAEFVATQLDDPKLFLLSARETSARSHVEDILRTRTNHLREIIDAQAGPVVVTNPEGQITLINRFARAFLAEPATSPLGIALETASWWDQDQSVRTRIREHVYHAAKGVTLSSDEEVYLPNGHIRQFALSFRPIFDVHRAVSHVVVSGLDVTVRERIRRGESLQEADVNESHFVSEVDHEGRWVNVGANLSWRIGQTEADLIGLPFWESIPGLRSETVGESFKRLLANELPALRFEIQSTTEDSINLIIGKRADDSNRFTVMMETPEFHHSDHKELVPTGTGDQVKTSILANVSHELRTPMNAILGLTSVALEENLEPQVKRWLEVSLGAAQQLMRILDDILEVSRIERGKLSLEHAIIEPIKVTRNIVEMFQAQANTKGIILSLSIMGDVPDQVMGDAGRLGQVITNLVSNAVKYTDAGRVDVELSCSSIEADQVELALEVRDTGVGIAAAAQRTIFEPFERAKSKSQAPGLGLGLSIARDLVTAMNGEIVVESAVDQGSLFRATMTFERPEPGPSVRAATTEVPIIALEEQRELLQVLVVDDTEANLLLVETVLRKRGHAITGLQSGIEALELVQKEHFDVILMDVNMPGMSGLETTKHIREWESSQGLPRSPIIALTAHAMMGDREQCLAAGMTGYISKPIDAHELTMQVENAPLRISPVAPNAKPDQAELPPVELAVAAALDRLGYDRNLFGKMMSVLQTEGPKLIALIEDNYLVSIEETVRAAHTLKNQAATVGAVTLARKARIIEERLRQGKQPTEVEIIVRKLGPTLKNSLRAINSLHS